MPLLFTALIFPVAFLLSVGTIAAMLASHGRRMVDALMLRPHGEAGARARHPVATAAAVRRGVPRVEIFRPAPALAYRRAA